ncbi:MAG: hypothetical protein OXC44_04370 [Proteobacteria bacterium]|nr:hypothetical protein [Pseudomonadota bacterium]
MNVLPPAKDIPAPVHNPQLLTHFCGEILKHPLAQKAYNLGFQACKSDEELHCHSIHFDIQACHDPITDQLHYSINGTFQPLDQGSLLALLCKPLAMPLPLHYALRGIHNALSIWAQEREITHINTTLQLMLSYSQKDVLIYFQNTHLNTSESEKTISNRTFTTKMRALAITIRDVLPSLKMAGIYTSVDNQPPELLHGNGRLYDYVLGMEWQRDFTSWPFPAQPHLSLKIIERVVELSGQGDYQKHNKRFEVCCFLKKNLERLSLLPFALASAGFGLHTFLAGSRTTLHDFQSEMISQNMEKSMLDTSQDMAPDLVVIDGYIHNQDPTFLKHLMAKSPPIILIDQLDQQATAFSKTLLDPFENTNYLVRQIEGFVHNTPQATNQKSSSTSQATIIMVLSACPSTLSMPQKVTQNDNQNT